MIACFSDPGLHSARETTRKPVLGIAECGILTALTLGHRFGVICDPGDVGAAAPALHRGDGRRQRLAADLPIGLGVTELGDERKTLAA